MPGEFFGRGYARGGKFAHLLRHSGDWFGGKNGTTMCGRWAPLGTGTQDEIERLASLPLCQFCSRKTGVTE